MPYEIPELIAEIKSKALVFSARAPPGTDFATWASPPDAAPLYLCLSAIRSMLNEHPVWVREFHVTHPRPATVGGGGEGGGGGGGGPKVGDKRGREE